VSHNTVSKGLKKSPEFAILGGPPASSPSLRKPWSLMNCGASSPLAAQG